MIDRPERLKDLSPQERRELLAALLRKDAETATPCPLSYGQRAMWYLYRLAPESAAYNVSFTARIRSEVDVAALKRALQGVVDRHEPLRLTFTEYDGKPVQMIHRHWEADLVVVDAAGWDDDTLYRRVNDAYREPFDLEHGPMLRACLFTRSADDHVLLLAAHHIILDGWAVWVLLDELRTLYAAERGAAGKPLPELTSQYSDYVHWQIDTLAGPTGERLWNYWREQLSGGLPTMDLPTDRPRPATQTFNGSTHLFTLSEDLSEAVKELAKDERTTVYTVLLAAFQTLLHRYSQQQEVIVGSPMAGRSRPEFAGLVGDFMNMVVLRANLEGSPSFRTFLAQVRDTVLAALDHQDFPFPLLVDRLAPRPDASRSPIFQVIFDMQRIQRIDELTDLLIPGKNDTRVDVGGGLVLEPYPTPQQEGQLDLILHMIEAGGALHGGFKYNTDLFDAATIERIASHFRTLLESVTADPDCSVDTLPMLTSHEREQLQAWAGPGLEFPVPGCIHQLVEAQAARIPDAIAVTCEEQQLSYAELNRRANQLARKLRALGVVDESPVALLLDRTPEMIVAVLAVLKAGGAYLPMDVAYPPERLGFILEDSGASIVVTREHLAGSLPPESDGDEERKVRVVRIDADWEDIATGAGDNLNLTANPERLAYIIYTSGSTGRPKGVMVTHANVVRLFTATQPWYSFDDQDVWSLFHSYAFDFSVWEMWGPLVHGGRLVIVPQDVSRSAEAFYDLLVKERVTVLNQTPSAFRQLMRAEEIPGKAQDLALRLVVFDGEVLEFRSLRPWFDRHGDTRPLLVNMYGITETTVHTMYRPVTCADADGALRTAIGIPIPDLQVYVLDAHGQQVPIGVPGELHVGGAGVARGYLNRPDLNAERFIQNPFSSDPSDRLYRSGDIVRYLPDGDIEYLGRVDFQVKVRGFRIELGEIENVLAQHPTVREAVVLAREDIGGERKLVAYLTTKDGSTPSPRELRTFLKAQLPDYMVPTAFVVLDVLPLTTNGKVDRRALPAPSQRRADLGDGFVAPQTPTERTLAGVWNSVLGIDRVGVYDNFFDLGGYSLQLIEVLAAVEDRIGVKLNPIFAQTQTLGQLATICDEMIARGEVQVPQPVSRGGNVVRAMRRMLGASS